MLPAYIVLTVSIGVFHILYKGDLSFILLVFLIAMPAVMFIILCIQTKLLKVKVTCVNSVSERGSPALLKVTLHNRSLLPMAACRVAVRYKPVFSAEKLPEEICGMTVPINPRSSGTVSLSLVPGHCGAVELYAKSIKITDLLGLTFLYKRVSYRDKTVILPGASPMNAEIESSPVSGAENSVFSDAKPGDDPSEIFALREYRDGDRMNRIHWKLSSRTESFIVKELSLPVSSKILVLCDFSGCERPTHTDAVLDAAMTLSSFLVRNGIDCALAASFNDGTPFTSEISDSSGLLAAFTELCLNIGRLDFKRGAEISDAAAVVKNGFSHVLVCVYAVNKAYAEELTRLCGDARLTVFCPNVSADVEEKSIAAEIIYSPAEAFSENEIRLNI